MKSVGKLVGVQLRSAMMPKTWHPIIWRDTSNTAYLISRVVKDPLFDELRRNLLEEFFKNEYNSSIN